jgi:hypothetical protein
MSESNDVKPVKPQPKSEHDAPRSHTLPEKKKCDDVSQFTNAAQREGTCAFLGKRIGSFASDNRQSPRRNSQSICFFPQMCAR